MAAIKKYRHIMTYMIDNIGFNILRDEFKVNILSGPFMSVIILDLSGIRISLLMRIFLRDEIFNMAEFQNDSHQNTEILWVVEKTVITLAVGISERGDHHRCTQIWLRDQKMIPPFDGRCCPLNKKMGVWLLGYNISRQTQDVEPMFGWANTVGSTYPMLT